MHTKWLSFRQNISFLKILKLTAPRLESNLQHRKGILKKYKKIRDEDQKKNWLSFS